MGWLSEMHRDAVAVICPEFTLEDEDQIEFHVNLEPGYHLSDNSWLDPYLAMTVHVRRGGRLVMSRTVEGHDVERSWQEMMERGTEREEQEREE